MQPHDIHLRHIVVDDLWSLDYPVGNTDLWVGAGRDDLVPVHPGDQVRGGIETDGVEDAGASCDRSLVFTNPIVCVAFFQEAAAVRLNLRPRGVIPERPILERDGPADLAAHAASAARHPSSTAGDRASLSG